MHHLKLSGILFLLFCVQHNLQLKGKMSLNAPELLKDVHLRAVVNANLNKATLLIVEDAVVRVLPVSVIVELHASCEALWILGRHQNPADKERWACLDS